MASLEGVAVVEVSSGIAGAYCGKLLADAGARVTVVEPVGGHPLRTHRTTPPPAEAGLHFELLMEGKDVVAGPADGAEAAALLAGADVVVEDGTLVAPGGSRPASVGDALLVSISPWGLTGPWADRPASDLTVQAVCGSLGRRALPGREPVMAGGAITGWLAGTYAAAAAAAFWWGGAARGRHLDVSTFECAALGLQPYITLEAAFRGGEAPPVRQYPAIPSVEPSSDGYVGFSTITAQQFHDFLVMIERPDLADDPDLVLVDRRNARREELLGAIHAWTGQHTTDEIVDLATAFRIPVAPIGNGENLPALDHLVERGVFEKTAGGRLRPRRPYRIEPAGIDAAGPAPADGPPSNPAPAGAPASGSASCSRGAGGALPLLGTTGGDLPLRGLRVADFTAFWAGPSATHLLASLGADVVKVESVQRPDGMRFTTVHPDADRWWEWGSVFHGVNGNKRSITLDLGDARGRELAYRLVEWADVVIENFSPRVMEHFGLGWAEVSARNPRAVMVRMPAFGLSGPWRDRTGFAMTVEQASGLAWQTGYEDGPPMDVGGVCDPFGGMHAVVALMVALGRRDVTGTGALVEVPLLETALNATAEQVTQYAATGVLPGRAGNRELSRAPQGVYRCRDDAWLALSVGDVAQWQGLVQVAGLPAWAGDPSLAGVPGRAAAHDRIDGELARWCGSVDGAVAVERLVAAGVPAAVIVAPAAIADNPHLVARGFFEEVDHPVVGRYRLPSLPFRVVGRAEPWNRRAAPTLGEHNDEVLGGLFGLDAATLASLAEARVIGTAP